MNDGDGFNNYNSKYKISKKILKASNESMLKNVG